MKALAATALMIMLASAASTEAGAQAEPDITPITQQALAPPPLALMLPFGPPPSTQGYKRMFVLQLLMATQDALRARQAIPLMRDSRSEADEGF